MTRTLEQRRAANPLERVNELSSKPDEFKKLYRSYVDRLGPSILMNGLGQALATERAAGGDMHAALYESVQQWLCGESDVYAKAPDLLTAITANDEALYLRAQVKALAWLDWHKKFCRAAFPKSEVREGEAP